MRRTVAAWQHEHERWQRRDLDTRRYVFVWADGVYLTSWLDRDRQCILVLIGAEADGRKELLAIEDGYRESTRSPRRSADLRGFANRIKGLLAFDAASCCSAFATRTAPPSRPSSPLATGPWAFGRRCTKAGQRRGSRGASAVS